MEFGLANQIQKHINRYFFVLQAKKPNLNLTKHPPKKAKDINQVEKIRTGEGI